MTKIMENKLNMVTGGTIDQTIFDSNALYSKGYMDEEVGSFDITFHWNNIQSSQSSVAAYFKSIWFNKFYFCTHLSKFRCIER